MILGTVSEDFPIHDYTLLYDIMVTLAKIGKGHHADQHSARAEEVGHDHVRTKSGRVAPYITLYKM